MNAKMSRRLRTAGTAVVLALMMLGLFVPVALAEDGEEVLLTVPENTPTTMSSISTTLDLGRSTTSDTGQAITNATDAACTTVAAVNTASTAMVKSLTSVPVPSVIQAGEGGSAGLDGPEVGLWALLLLAVALTIGLCSSALTSRRGAGCGHGMGSQR